VVALGCAAVLGIAVRLDPSPDGFGTHQQLGMPQCGFLARTGYPCPTCGVTTSVAWAVRGRLLAGWRAQPFGVLLAAGLAAGALAGVAEAVTGRPKLPTGRRSILLAAGLLLAALGGGWAWKVAEGCLNGSLPLR
jgi:hypothetical protein